MINTLNIGKYIYNKLKQTGVDVNPLVAETDTKYPFIIYKRIGLNSNGCKDGFYEDDVTVEIVIVAEKYEQSIEIANSVRQLLENPCTIQYDDMEIQYGTLIFAVEEFNEAYIQRMQFNFKINNI